MPESMPVLADPERDRLLRRDGFTTVRITDADTALRLRATYLRLRGEDGSGMSIDLNIDEPAYRREIAAAASDALDAGIVAAFADHRPFIRSFLCKYSGPDTDMYLHQDWTYVDERTDRRTYVCWVALQDTDGDNGQLRVLRGSHLIDETPRGTNLTAPFVGLEDAIVPRLLSVPVKAGEAIVFDNALVHSSYPNFTDEPRVAVGVCVRPNDVPLVHYLRTSDTTADRYDIDESFFFDHTPAQLMAQPPAELEPAEHVQLTPRSITSAELGRRLDAGRQGRLDQLRRTVRSAEAEVQRIPERAARRLVKVNEAIIRRYGPEA